MKSVIILSREPINLNSVSAKFKESGFSVSRSANRIVVEGRQGWFALECDNSIIEDYEEDEINKLNRLLSNTISLAQLEFSNIDAVNNAIAKMDHIGDFVVDNDHGLFLNLKQINNFADSSVDWTSLDSNQAPDDTPR
jgi:hypothetical protein